MSLLRGLALLPLLFLGALAACSPAGESASEDAAVTSKLGTAVADGSDVVAEVNGVKITRAELEEEAGPRLARLRQEEYEIRRDTLEAMIAERLLETEARKRGVSAEELLASEVEQEVPTPPAAQLEGIYERNKARFAGQTREQAYARIAQLLRERELAERRADFQQGLRARASVMLHLEAPRVTIDLPDHALGTGPDDAPVTIVEFTDYQCPFCHRAQGTIDRILAEYPGKVRVVHLDYPLENHPGAVPAARAARCAGEQGRFWEYHRNLMNQQGSLDEADLVGRAASLKLDEAQFRQCLASDRYDESIHAQLEQGIQLGVTGTPAYFINGRMISGAQPYPAFAQVIDDELAAS
jgi:protein-disulfide isomerase